MPATRPIDVIYRWALLTRQYRSWISKSIRGNCSDSGVPAPYGLNITPIRVYHRRGRLIGESQERVASAKLLPGDEVEQLVDLASIGWNRPLTAY